MPASVRTRSGFVRADAQRGGVSVGARDVPMARVEAVEVRRTAGDADNPATYSVALAVAGDDIALAEDAGAFGEARALALEFARECGVPIRDHTLGRTVTREWSEWASTLRERHRHAPPPRPPRESPGDEFVYHVEGDAMVFHSRPGSFTRMWKRPGAKPKKKWTVGQWIGGAIVLPLFLVLVLPLAPLILLALAAVHLRTGGKGPLLLASAAGVRLKRLDDEWMPAEDIRDVEIGWAADAATGELAPRDLVVRSDAAVISYGASGATEAEMEWMRGWVRALVCGG